MHLLPIVVATLVMILDMFDAIPFELLLIYVGLTFIPIEPTTLLKAF